MWRFRGSPHYLDQQAHRLGITQILADRARNNAEIYRLAVLLAQLSERYHRARREDGKPVFYMTDLAQIKGTLEQCELELQKLHMLAASAHVMLDEAWQAFGYEQPRRDFEVLCNLDKPQQVAAESLVHPLPFGDGTAGIADGESEVFAQSL